MSFFLVHVGQVQRNTHNIALGRVVTLFFVVVDDVEITVFLAGGHVLEVVEVERVGQDVVAVATLERVNERLRFHELLARRLGTFQRLLLLVRQDLNAEHIGGVLILFYGPLSIFVV